MGLLGDLAEALIEAPRCRTLHLRGRLAIDHAVLRRAMEGDAGPASSRPPIDEPVELWWDAGPPLRWRAVHGSWVAFVDGHRRVVQLDDEAHVRVHDAERGSVPGLFRPLLDGSVVLGGFRLETPTTDVVLGRAVWRVPADARTRSAPRRIASDLADADRIELVVDQATGIALGIDSYVDGELLSVLVVDELEVDPALDEALFVPVGEVKETADLVREHRERDAAAEVERGLLRHQPSGPPPEDEASARAAVTEAFVRLFEPSDDGVDLPFVRGGEGLGPFAQATMERFGQSEPATVKVRAVAFVHAERATVWFDVVLRDGLGVFGRQGSAVLTADGWLVARRTLARLYEGVGLLLPPEPPGAVT